jgi:hypothetical protein
MKYAGVVEGFYGRPWSADERQTLFAWMQDWGGLTAYLYAPKDDLKHRRQWRTPYTTEECEVLRALIQSAKESGVRFIYAISPGLDIDYGNSADQAVLEEKLSVLIDLGAEHFALLFDDIPESLTPRDRAFFGSLAAAQSALTVRVQTFLRARALSPELLFCPTVYCDRQANFDVADNPYLMELGQSLPLSVDVLWTGPEVISPAIQPEDLKPLQQVLGRKPVLWDNLHANDYDMRRTFLGPYGGRPLSLRNEVEGILSNPNCEFHLNELPLGSLAAYIQGDSQWNAEADFQERRKEWGKRFDHCFSDADLELLCDCFYLPMKVGPSCQALLTAARESEGGEVLQEATKRLSTMYEAIAGISNRSLFYALHPYIWDAYTTLGTSQLGSMIMPEFLPKTSEGDFLRRLERRKMGPEGLEPPTK